MKEIHQWIYLVHGKVQGVGYRQSVLRFLQNKNFNLCGYVKNLPEGMVEILAQGDEEELQALSEFCRRGPLMSRVDQVEIQKVDTPITAFTYCDFTIERS